MRKKGSFKPSPDDTPSGRKSKVTLRRTLFKLCMSFFVCLLLLQRTNEQTDERTDERTRTHAESVHDFPE